MLLKIYKKLIFISKNNFFSNFLFPSILGFFLKSVSVLKFFNGNNLSLAVRKAKHASVNYDHLKFDSVPQISLIVQGGVNNLTELFCCLRALKISRKHNINVILSTWKNQKFNWILKFLCKKDKENIFYLDKPKVFGAQNINLQLTSSHFGISKAKYNICLKIRTDHYILNEKLFFIMCSLFEVDKFLTGSSALKEEFAYRDQFVLGEKSKLLDCFDPKVNRKINQNISVENYIFSRVKDISFKVVDITLIPLVWCKYPDERFWGSSRQSLKRQLTLWL